jgi:replication-associated recombination protein RarA
MSNIGTETKIHSDIQDKLVGYIARRRVPNLIFHGASGSGKKTLLFQFINSIYKNDNDIMKKHIMHVNCAHGKGIKFIRDDLKFFAKTHIHSQGGNIFKSIILLNADKLTIDAQSALRRCIEQFSNNTRFFIVVEDKYKLLKPILSRFCEIYVPEPMISKKQVNLHKYNIDQTFNFKSLQTARPVWLRKELLRIKTSVADFSQSTNTKTDITNMFIDSINKLYEKGYSALDLLQMIESNTLFSYLTDEKKYELLFSFHKIKSDLRGERTLMLFIFNFVFLSLDCSLENITFM